MANDAQLQDPRLIADLHAAFTAADNIILKKYVSDLTDAGCIEMTEDAKTLEIGNNVALYRLAKVVYDKNENVRDKLTTVYSTIFSLKNCGLVMLIYGHKSHTDLFLGVVNRHMEAHLGPDDAFQYFDCNSKELADCGRALESSFSGNFPGSELIAVLNNSITPDQAAECKEIDCQSKREIIHATIGQARYISAVSSIPAIRNDKESKNEEFVQGLEKLIDTMKGKEYAAIVIADAMSNSKIEEMCAQYEDIYTQLAPFKGSSQTVSLENGNSVTEGIVTGVTNTTNKTITEATTHGTSQAKTKTNTVGGSVGSSSSAGVSIGFNGIGANSSTSVSMSANYSHAVSRTEGKMHSETKGRSTGTAKSLTEQNSVAKALSTTTGETLQIHHENRAVKTLLDRIDEQIKRMRSCEDFGMFDTCIYFASKNYDDVIAGASAFKSLTRGENSSIESSAVNVWHTAEDVSHIKDYLMRFYHPEFLTYLDKTHHYATTAAMLVSGREMAYQMPLPKKSVAGVPVVECAEFAREIVSLSPVKQDLYLGHVYHMHKTEPTAIRLDASALTGHTFITGSTGSGKSTTVYQLLSELSSMPVDNGNQRVKFMVIEPAKGEYKTALAHNKKFDLRIYGTNPNVTRLLRINPFRFRSDRIHIYEHLDKLTEIFNVCWPMYAAMPAVLKAAMENAYRSAGWDLIKSENPYGNVFPTFEDVAREVEKYVNKSAYSEENKSNYKGALLTRLESLTNGINRIIFSSDDLDDRELFEENVVVDLSRVGSTETKALLMGILVLKLQEYKIANAAGYNADLRHVTVLEEAHNLLKRTSTEQSAESSNLLGKSVEMLANSIAEMRAYGEGFIVADQSPGLLDLSVIRNTNTKIIMKLPDFSDRQLVGKAAGLNEGQIDELAKLPKGVAAVYQSEWIAPVLCAVQRPALHTGDFVEPNGYPESSDEKFPLDLLKPELTEQLDDAAEAKAFQQSILRSSVSTELKVKLLDYLQTEKSPQRVKKLAALLFDYFENAKEVLEEAAESATVDRLKTVVMAELTPSILQHDDGQIDLLITLIIKEYMDRYYIDHPIWKEFVDKVARGEVI